MKPIQEKKTVEYGDSFEARERHTSPRSAGTGFLVAAGLTLVIAGILFFIVKNNKVPSFLLLALSLFLGGLGIRCFRLPKTPVKKQDPVLVIDGKGITANRGLASFSVPWEKIGRYEVCDPTTTAGHVADVAAAILAAAPLPSSRERIALSIYRRVPEDEKPLRVSLIMLDHTPEEIAEALEHYKPRNVFALVNII